MRHPPISWSLFVALLLLGAVPFVGGVSRISSPDEVAKLAGQLLPREQVTLVSLIPLEIN